MNPCKFYKVYEYVNYIGERNIEYFLSEGNATVRLNEMLNLYPHCAWYLSEVHPKDAP